MAEGSEPAKEIVSAANGIDYAYPNTDGGSEGVRYRRLCGYGPIQDVANDSRALPGGVAWAAGHVPGGPAEDHALGGGGIRDQRLVVAHEGGDALGVEVLLGRVQVLNLERRRVVHIAELLEVLGG